MTGNCVQTKTVTTQTQISLQCIQKQGNFRYFVYAARFAVAIGVRVEWIFNRIAHLSSCASRSRCVCVCVCSARACAYVCGMIWRMMIGIFRLFMFRMDGQPTIATVCGLLCQWFGHLHSITSWRSFAFIQCVPPPQRICLCTCTPRQSIIPGHWIVDFCYGRWLAELQTEHCLHPCARL